MILATVTGLILITAILSVTGSTNYISTIEKVALGYVIGCGILTSEMFIIGLFYNISLTTILLVNIILNMILLMIIYRYDEDFNIVFKWDAITRYFRVMSPRSLVQRIIEFIKRTDKFTIVSMLIILFNIIYTCIWNLYWPISDWDGLAIWDYKGYVFYKTGRITMDKIYTRQHPLLTPLLHTYVYLWIGDTAPNFIKLIYSFYYIALLIIWFLSMEKETGSTNKAIVYTTMLATIYILIGHTIIAYADIVLTTQYSVGILYLYRYYKLRSINHKAHFKYLSAFTGLLFGMVYWTKEEGVAYLLIGFLVIIMLSIRIKHRVSILIFLVCALPFTIPWFLTSKLLFQIESVFINNFLDNSLSLNLDSIIIITKSLLSEMTINRITFRIGIVFIWTISLWGWNLLWIFLLVCLISESYDFWKRRRITNLSLFFLPIFFLNILLIYGIFSYTIVPLLYHIETYMTRGLLHFAPIVLFYSMSVLDRKITGGVKSEGRGNIT